MLNDDFIDVLDESVAFCWIAKWFGFSGAVQWDTPFQGSQIHNDWGWDKTLEDSLFWRLMAGVLPDGWFGTLSQWTPYSVAGFPLLLCVVWINVSALLFVLAFAL